MAVKVNCLNPIAACGMELLPDTYEITDNYADADAVLVRSASMHDLELSDKLLCVARAGAGVNNIPLDKCAEKGVVVFNTQVQMQMVLRTGCSRSASCFP